MCFLCSWQWSKKLVKPNERITQGHSWWCFWFWWFGLDSHAWHAWNLGFRGWREWEHTKGAKEGEISFPCGGLWLWNFSAALSKAHKIASSSVRSKGEGATNVLHSQFEEIRPQTHHYQNQMWVFYLSRPQSLQSNRSREGFVSGRHSNGFTNWICGMDAKRGGSILMVTNGMMPSSTGVNLFSDGKSMRNGW